MQYLLDTCTCVFCLRGKLNLADIIREKGRQNFLISGITVAELLYGAENSDNRTQYFIAFDELSN